MAKNRARTLLDASTICTTTQPLVTALLLQTAAKRTLITLSSFAYDRPRMQPVSSHAASATKHPFGRQSSLANCPTAHLAAPSTLCTTTRLPYAPCCCRNHLQMCLYVMALLFMTGPGCGPSLGRCQCHRSRAVWAGRAWSSCCPQAGTGSRHPLRRAHHGSAAQSRWEHP